MDDHFYLHADFMHNPWPIDVDMLTNSLLKYHQIDIAYGMKFLLD